MDWLVTWGMDDVDEWRIWQGEKRGILVYTKTQSKHTWIKHIPINLHTVFALLCFVMVIHWMIFPYPSGLLYWHCGNLTIAPVPAKQPWWIWINTSCEFIMNDCITTTKQSTTKPCAYFLGYTVVNLMKACNTSTYWLMNMDKYFMWIYYERLHNHNKAKHNKTVCIFLGIYCSKSHESL